MDHHTATDLHNAELSTLNGLIRNVAVTYGDFKLRSGATSSYYLDCKKLALTTVGQLYLGRCLCNAMRLSLPTVITGLESGAIPLVCAVVNSFPQYYYYEAKGSFVRKGGKDYGTKKMVEGCEITGDDNVVVLEDVVTRGDSMIQAIKAVQALSPKSVHAYCVVDKLQGGSKKILDECGVVLIPLFTVRDLGLE